MKNCASFKIHSNKVLNFFAQTGMEGIYYEPSKRSGQHLLVFNGVRYFRNRRRGHKQYWKCSWYYKTKCPSIIVVDEGNECYETQHHHKHERIKSGLDSLEILTI